MKRTVIIAVLAALFAIFTVLPAAAGEMEMKPTDVTTLPVGQATQPTPPTTQNNPTGTLGGGLLSSATPTAQISAALSPAIDIIAANSPMAKAGLTGKEISFSEADFARALNLRRVDSVTFLSVPASSDGVILLGNTTVTAGQSIPRASIGMLTYEPATDKSGVTSFEISVNESGYAIVCSLYSLDSPNANPTVDMTAETMLDLGGYANTALFGKLGAYDPEGDALTFEIVDAPEHGLLIMNDKSAGNYTYLPENGYTGRDSFSYVVCDKYGNYSSSAKVSLTISTPSTSVVYGDTVGRRECCAAIKMTEKGIMGGTQAGSVYYFEPDKTLSREDFLVLAMKAAGISSLPSFSETGFYDEESISASARPYVAAARRLGYIEGTKDKNGNLCFLPTEELTRAEAALMVDKIMDGASHLSVSLTVSPVFRDFSEVPAWAQSSVTTLAKLGVMLDESGNINANDAITRGQAAMMLAAMMQVMDRVG